ncbi:MAG: serine protease [Ilumatobacteraceae bacterium]|nr:serine protease [Ilumatobacteraceae bacterium]
MYRHTRAFALGSAVILAAAAVSTSVAAAASPSNNNGSKGGYVEVPNSAYVLQPGDTIVDGQFPNDPVRFEGALKVRNEGAAAALALAVSDPANQSYGQFLSPSQYRQRFAATDSDARTVTGWLQGAGLNITYNPANHIMIAADGRVSQADVAFKTDIRRIQDSDGFVFLAPVTPLFVPKAVVGIVDGFVEGINTPSRLAQPQNATNDGGQGDGSGRDGTGRGHGHGNGKHSAHTTPPVPTPDPGAPPDDAFIVGTPCSAYFGQQVAPTPDLSTAAVTPPYANPVTYAPCGYKPAQMQGAYDVSSLLKKGIDGKGVTVAITDAYASPTIAGDINQFAGANGGAAWGNKFSQIKEPGTRFGYNDAVNGDQCGEQGWYGEETLDVESVHTMAPGAKVLYVGAASCLDQDLLAAVNDVVDNHRADIVSNSWGGINEVVDPTLLDVYNAIFIQAALEGIGTFFSSGDNGDETGGDGVPADRTVDFPASDPFVTAVGGTTLEIGAQNNYISEGGWGTYRDVIDPATGQFTDPLPGSYNGGAGGGTSQLFAEPAYQQGVVPASISNFWNTGTPGRAVPDIAALADPTTGILVGQTETFGDGSVHYGEYRIGGTSVASPLMAGIEALADQAAGHAHGFANPAIYRIDASALHDITAPAQTLAAVRVDYNTSDDPTSGTFTSLRTLGQGNTLAVTPGYDDITGVGSPIASVYAAKLGQKSRH